MPSGTVSDGACPYRIRANYTERKITRTPAQTKPESQAATVLDSDLMWQVIQEISGGYRACHRKKTVGEPYEGKPHVRFEVEGDGNQDMVWVFEALSKETESKQAAQPKSQAPSLDPTRRPHFRAGGTAAPYDRDDGGHRPPASENPPSLSKEGVVLRPG